MQIDFQIIYDQLSMYLPEEWEKLVVLISLHDELSEINFYYKVDNEYICALDDGYVSREMFNSLSNVLALVRLGREKNDVWKTCTIAVCSDGEFKAEYDNVHDFMDENFVEVCKNK